MKKKLISLLMVLTVSLIVNKAGAVNDKKPFTIAVVNLRYVFNNHPYKKWAYNKIKKQKNIYLNEIKTKTKELKKIEKHFESLKNNLKEVDKKRKIRNIKTKREKLNVITKKRAKELKLLEDKLRKPILKSIFKAIEKVRKKNKYTIVLNKSDVLAYSKQIDITKQVIKLVRKYP